MSTHDGTALQQCRHRLDSGLARRSMLALSPLLTGLGCDVLWQPYEVTFARDCGVSASFCPTEMGLVDGGSDSGAGDGPGVWPASCAQWQQQGKNTDGDYTLYVQGDAKRPYIVYCNGMNGVAAEYLYLQTPSNNASQYQTIGGTVTTQYHHVRLNPATLQVVCDDQADVNTVGVQFYFATRVTSMPFAVAVSAGTTTTVANLDLTGTAFAVAPGAFTYYRDETKGFLPADNTQAAYKSNGQVVVLTAPFGTGEFVAPNPGSNRAFNKTSGLLLQLTYVGM